jgi:hypothetical protein
VAAEEQDAIVRAYIGMDSRIRDQVTAAVVNAFRALGSWREADIARFVDAVVPIVLGAQRQVGSITQAYLTALLADMAGEGVSSSTADVATGAVLRKGADPAEVYARPIRTVWQGLAAGADLSTALDTAALRLAQILATDLQLAKTHAARAVLAGDERIVGYRRVLTGIKTCGLCVVASTQRYHRGDLMPIHPGCDCAVAPIIGTEDPGHVLDEPLLEGTHQAIQDRFGTSDRSARMPDYRDVLITHEHGEIGPVIARRGDHFTGPGDLH